MSWLSSLPHQIPFRAASAVVRRDAKTIEGKFLCTANDTLSPEVMVVEAMAQFGGGLAIAEAAHGLLTGLEQCEVLRPIEPGDVVEIRVTHDASFGGLHRFSGSGSIGGLECVRARFYLAEPTA
jgi:3-hydroxymyristoyl/3-hydroxydecanoyl-(acyl carrier protein) dehydratase